MKAMGKLAITIGPALAAAVGVMPVAAAAAVSADPLEPTYQCMSLVDEELPYAEGFNCVAVNGALEHSPYLGEFPY